MKQVLNLSQLITSWRSAFHYGKLVRQEIILCCVALVVLVGAGSTPLSLDAAFIIADLFGSLALTTITRQMPKRTIEATLTEGSSYALDTCCFINIISLMERHESLRVRLIVAGAPDPLVVETTTAITVSELKTLVCDSWRATQSISQPTTIRYFSRILSPVNINHFGLCGGVKCLKMGLQHYSRWDSGRPMLHSTACSQVRTRQRTII